jgi:hypothetical protein
MSRAARCFGLGLMLLCLSAAPASQPVAKLRAIVQQLSDTNSEKREAALSELLNLKPAELPRLRQAVADARPLAPGQVALLRQAVRHIYISGADYPIDQGNQPFLGLSWDTDFMPEWADLGGVPVMRRVPGFAAYQVLREGDVIQGIEEIPGTPLRTTGDVRLAITSAFQAGQTVTLNIQRQGKSMRVRVELRARPVLPGDLTGLETWIDEQTAAADQYWDSHFSSLLEENVT